MAGSVAKEPPKLPSLGGHSRVALSSGITLLLSALEDTVTKEPDRAMSILRQLISILASVEGTELNKETMSPIISACSESFDWFSALLCRIIASVGHDGPSKHLSEAALEALLRLSLLRGSVSYALRCLDVVMSWNYDVTLPVSPIRVEPLALSLSLYLCMSICLGLPTCLFTSQPLCTSTCSLHFEFRFFIPSSSLGIFSLLCCSL